MNQVGKPEHLLQEEVEIEQQLATLENQTQMLEMQLQEQVQLRLEVTSQAEDGGSQPELLFLMEQEEQQIKKQIDGAVMNIARLQQKKEEIAHHRETIQGLKEELQPSKHACSPHSVCDENTGTLSSVVSTRHHGVFVVYIVFLRSVKRIKRMWQASPKEGHLRSST